MQNSNSGFWVHSDDDSHEYALYFNDLYIGVIYVDSYNWHYSSVYGNGFYENFDDCERELTRCFVEYLLEFSPKAV